MISFVVTNDPHINLLSFEYELKQWMIQKMGKALLPKRIIYLDEKVGDLSSLENQDVLEEIRYLRDRGTN